MLLKKLNIFQNDFAAMPTTAQAVITSPTLLGRYMELEQRTKTAHIAAAVALGGCGFVLYRCIFVMDDAAAKLYPLLFAEALAIAAKVILALSRDTVFNYCKIREAKRVLAAEKAMAEQDGTQTSEGERLELMNKMFDAYMLKIAEMGLISALRILEQELGVERALLVAYDVCIAQGQYDTARPPVQLPQLEPQTKEGVFNVFLATITGAKGSIQSLWELCSYDDRQLLLNMRCLDGVVPRDVIQAAPVIGDAQDNGSSCDLAQEFSRYKNTQGE